MIPSTFAMRNRYFAVRHAESQANVDGIIVSLPANALVCPLTLAGIAHATAVRSAFITCSLLPILLLARLPSPSHCRSVSSCWMHCK
eukprot:m.91461 g.91461  ORF g.91461 m.91461 type:complete len:87 (+) comp51145_c0_seq3:2-262(+)